MTAQDIKTTRKPARKPPVKRKLKVNIENALILKQAGQSYKEIAADMNTCPSNVHKQIQHLLPTELTETYKQQRADIFAELQCKMLSQVDEATLKGMIERRGLVDMGILYDKERIERGLGDHTKQPLVLILRDRIIEKAVDNSQVIDIESAPLIESDS